MPLLTLMLIALSQIIDQDELLATLGRYLELFGAQVIAEYERIGTKGQGAAPQPLRT